MRNKSVRFGDVIELDWNDAAVKYGWKDIDGKFELSHVKSVGQVVRSNKNSVTISTSVATFANQTPDVSEPFTIPWSGVNKLKVIKRNPQGR